MTEPGGAASAPGAAAPAPLTPPSPAPLTLTAPEPVPPVVDAQAPAMAPQVDARHLPALDDRVEGYLTALLKNQTRSPEFARQAENVRTMGDADLRKAAETSERLLQSPVKAQQEGGLSEDSTVGRTLLELRRMLEELDPGQAGAPRKLLGMIPFGDKVADYFRRYPGAQGHLDTILHDLRTSQDELTRDNVGLNLEKQNLWTVMSRLNAYIYVAEQLEGRLEEKIAELEPVDPGRAEALSQDVLRHVRQKHRALLTQLAVSIESYLAVDLVIQNNLELVKGLDRASTTTVSALRTAVVVAQALNQRLVLDRVSALRTTTSDTIERTSELLRDRSASPQKQAASATVGLPQLQAAFAAVGSTLDAIDAYKAEALTAVRTTIGVLESEVTRSRSHAGPVPGSGADLIPGGLELDPGAESSG